MKVLVFPSHHVWGSAENVCVLQIAAMCAAPCGCGGSSWSGQNHGHGLGGGPWGLTLLLVDYFYDDYFNKVHIKMIIKVSCRGWGLGEEESLWDIISCWHQRTGCGGLFRSGLRRISGVTFYESVFKSIRRVHTTQQLPYLLLGCSIETYTLIMRSTAKHKNDQNFMCATSILDNFNVTLD